MANKSKATKIKDLNNFVGEVALFELSKGIKKGATNHKYVVISRHKPVSGSKNTTVWLSDDAGEIRYVEPIADLVSEDMRDALEQLGYNLV